MSEPTILQRIQSDLTAAMKAQDAAALSTLRMLKAALMEAQTRKSKNAPLTVEEQIAVLQRYVKQRREAIEELAARGDRERAASEEREIAVTRRYLPQPFGEDELEGLVRGVITRIGATGPRDAGKVIGAVMAEARGRAEGGVVARLVRRALEG